MTLESEAKGAWHSAILHVSLMLQHLGTRSESRDFDGLSLFLFPLLAQTAALEKRITASADAAAAAMQKPMHRLTHVLTLHLRFAAALAHKK